MSALIPPVPILDYASLDKDQCVPHPSTGALSYGQIEPYSSRNLSLPGGEIYLRVGKHFGYSSGFGVNHIWTGHAHELPKWGCKRIEDVPAFVAAIISPGAQVLCEFHQTRDGYRLAIVRGSRGCAVLSPQADNRGVNHYSVVTAYKVHRGRDATRVGTLKAKKAP